MNIINVLCPAPATGSDLIAIAAVFQAWWDAQFRAHNAVTTVWVGVDLTALDSPGSPFLAYTNSGIPTGAFGSNSYPPNVALVASLRTGLSGRSFQGRIYMAGVATINAISGGLLAQSVVDVYAADYNNLRTRLATAGYPLVVLSLYSGIDGDGEKIPRAAGIATPVTAIVVGRRVDSQRRRLPRESRA